MTDDTREALLVALAKARVGVLPQPDLVAALDAHEAAARAEVVAQVEAACDARLASNDYDPYWSQDEGNAFIDGAHQTAKAIRAALAAPADTTEAGDLLPGCTCPDDCDCDGRLRCNTQAGQTSTRCELPRAHDGWHVSGSHRWSRPADTTEAGT